MSSFENILQEKLKKQDILTEVSIEETHFLSENSGLSDDLLKWLNSSPLTQKYNHKQYCKVDESSYSIYKKDLKVLEVERFKREKSLFNAFLAQFSSEIDRTALEFFYAQGARSFMSGREADLKRDYRKLALKLHPDRHFNEIPSVQRQFQEDFRVLSESYDTLKMLFSRAK